MAGQVDPPVTQAGYLVLLALASGHDHGYGIARFVDQLTAGQVQLPEGTLYRTISRLSADKLVHHVEAAAPAGVPSAGSSRRKRYRLTQAGRRVVVRESMILSNIVRAAEAAGCTPHGRNSDIVG